MLGSSSARSMVVRSWNDNGLLRVVFGSSLPSSYKIKKKIGCLSWTLSEKTFWIRAWVQQKGGFYEICDTHQTLLRWSICLWSFFCSVDVCHYWPCNNGGICVEDEESYKCKCVLENGVGPNCATVRKSYK